MNPLTIYQNALNIVSEAVLAGDFFRYAAMIDFPYLVHTADADLLVTTTADLLPAFEAVHRGLTSRGVTHYERVARSADYVDRNRIEGRHHTHMLADGQPVNCAHASGQTIVRRGELWLFSEAHYDAVKGDRWPLTFSNLFDAADALGLPEAAK